ncbi:MAG: MqnA/MqnD/SBP family protein, partial [Acidobacteriota bacterium]
NRRVQFFEQPPRPRQMLEQCQAALVIGNPALHVDAQGLIVYDLAHEWHRFTGLPFVFAFWAVAEGVDLGRRAELFYRSEREGKAQIEQISQLYAEKLGLAVQEVRDYLTGNLDYSLDEENLRGLETFFGLAAKWGLIDDPQPLRFCDVEVGEFHAKPQRRKESKVSEL